MQGGGEVISGSGSNKKRSKRLEKRSATKIKIWFWDILDRQANFGRGSRVLGRGGVKGRRRVKRKNMPQHLKKYCARNIMIPRGFFNLVSGSRHREALGFPPFQIIFPSFRRH